MPAANQVKSRTIAIADIHGHIKALVGLIDLINPNPEDTLIFLGDYINRGPDSKGVLQFIIDLKQRCNVVCIMGNHEEMMINAYSDPSTMGWFLENGGHETLQSYGPAKNLSFVPQMQKNFHIVFTNPNHSKSTTGKLSFRSERTRINNNNTRNSGSA